MADAPRVAVKSQLILMLSQRVRVGTPDNYHLFSCRDFNGRSGICHTLNYVTHSVLTNESIVNSVDAL